MVSSWKAGVLALVLVAASGAAFAWRGGGQEKAAAKIDDFAWLAGAWQMVKGDTIVEEHWTPPAGGALLGVGRTLAKERMAFFEFLRLETRKDGLVYVAHPAGRSPGTEFKLASWNGTEAVFENPTHDFPTKVRYTKQDDGSLIARVEGTQGGQPASEEFHYSRLAK